MGLPGCCRQGYKRTRGFQTMSAPGVQDSVCELGLGTFQCWDEHRHIRTQGEHAVQSHRTDILEALGARMPGFLLSTRLDLHITSLTRFPLCSTLCSGSLLLLGHGSQSHLVHSTPSVLWSLLLHQSLLPSSLLGPHCLSLLSFILTPALSCPRLLHCCLCLQGSTSFSLFYLMSSCSPC